MTCLESLRKTYLFKSLSEEHIKSIGRLAREKSFDVGAEIFQQGQSATTLHVLMQGSVGVRLVKGNEFDTIASKLTEAGSVLGTASLVAPFVYNVTAEALAGTHTLAFKASDLNELMTGNPAMGFEVMNRLASRYLNRLNSKRMGMMNLVKAFKSQIHKSEMCQTYMEAV